MRIAVDREVCICSGMCTTISPLLFELNGNGELDVIEQGELSSQQQTWAQDAIALCPVEAISLAARAAADG